MRYIIGIDLGTTNSCISYVDTQHPKASIQSFAVPQLLGPSYIGLRHTLPSFVYLSAPMEWQGAALDLPWKKNNDTFVGFFAHAHGARVPTRLVQSAKSWLSYSVANRNDKILPPEASEADQKISPLEATAHYLNHIRHAWNYLMAKSNPEAEFEQQEIVLTVPASFDEVARRLTVEAAKMAGFIHLTLLEEPQAAFYSWISLHENQWQQQMQAGQTILVCDVGGGTTDFSLIEVQQGKSELTLNRRAVGDHLLLGGDNMDIALAHYLEERLSHEYGKRDFQLIQWLQLKHQAKAAKEALLENAASAVDHFTVLLQGSGSAVVKGSLSIQVKRQEVAHLLLNGFFAQYSLEEALQLRRSTGFRMVGLPYEEEPSITKHLATFLKRSQFQKAPDYILFNGGSMKPTIFQQALICSLERWYPGSQTKILESVGLDIAVARGAAYYGKVRRGYGVRIASGIPKTYYLGIDVKKFDGTVSNQALTLLPRGAEEGASYQCEHTFSLRPNVPVSFSLYTSQVRLDDQKGDIIEIDNQELQAMPAIHTILRVGKKQLSESVLDNIPVKLHIKLTAIGTLEVWLQSPTTGHRWPLEFQVRQISGQENNVSSLESKRQDESFDSSYLKSSQEYLREIFTSSTKAEKMMEKLENYLDRARLDWPLSLLRGLFDTLLSLADQRKASADLEPRWWNMIGFFLRPGFGYPLDDFRIKELWKIILGDFKLAKSFECLIQQWICYRRIAGGLNKGQQIQLANDILATLLPNKTSKIILKSKNDIYSYSEKIRTLASFEWLDLALKRKIGLAILTRICADEAVAADYWALGRIGARHLIYGSLAYVVPSEECSRWIESLLKLSPHDPLAHLLGQLARKTAHREVDISQTTLDNILNTFSLLPQHEHLQRMLTQTATLTLQEQEQAFGEKLPAGLILEREK
ncbi:hsp70 family protein [Neochlamydia sp. S13]|uniref:hsp70 family protein n=1 Tax=Neochlamydia sp. S13 TaxID=1353976 RepID=UPI0005A609BE|nr:hsp70 family protein [Neochlamydia sp. S13]BBI18147.1 Uncharacterized protein NCS13_1_1952 [Neochlamydia sp. S13]